MFFFLYIRGNVTLWSYICIVDHIICKYFDWNLSSLRSILFDRCLFLDMQWFSYFELGQALDGNYASFIMASSFAVWRTIRSFHSAQTGAFWIFFIFRIWFFANWSYQMNPKITHLSVPFHTFFKHKRLLEKVSGLVDVCRI